MPVAPLLGATASRIALDKEQFALRWIALLAIGELAGERRYIERTLAPGQIAGLARGFSCGSGFNDFRDDAAGFGGMFLDLERETSDSPLRRALGRGDVTPLLDMTDLSGAT